MKQPRIKPPAHLTAESQRWWLSVLEEYSLEPHHIKPLTLACEAHDRATQARKAIAEHGITYTDRFGAPRKRPEVSVEESARIAFSKIVRELDLDIDPPSTPSRPPALHSNRRT